MNRIKNISVFIIVMFITIVSAKAQGWVIPEENKNISNPLEINSSTIEKGSELYIKNCKSCHGDVGKANFIALNPSPGDLGTATFKTANTPGAIFYKITTGKVVMPSFKTTLSDDDRWAIVAYLNPEASSSLNAENTAITGNAKLSIATNDESKEIIVSMIGKDSEGKDLKVNGAKIEIYAKRYFGELLLLKGKTTSNGSIAVKYPEDLPGDTLGVVNIIVRATDYKQEETVSVNWGAPNKHQRITEQASIWGTNANAPWWIILLYVGIAGAVWSVIVYIGLQIFKLIKLGKK